MKKLTSVLALILMLMPALAGCGGVRHPKYYALNVPPGPDPVARGKRGGPP
jgi:predicted small lipoprotein YifL